MKEVASFVILGSSSGFPQAHRASSGYLLKVGNSCSLIDCGGGVTSSFLRTGIDPLSVDRIFISHTHPDHVCELPLFIQLVYLKGRTKKLDIYVPSEFEKIFNQYLNAVYLFKERMPFELKVIGYEHGFEFYGNFSLEAFDTKHLIRYSEEVEKMKLPNKMQCHLFVINASARKILYSADIDSFDDVKDHLNGCHYAIIESTHIDLNEFLKAAPDFEVNRYILTHLGNPQEVEEIRSAIKKSGLKNIDLAEDGLELPL